MEDRQEVEVLSLSHFVIRVLKLINKTLRYTKKATQRTKARLRSASLTSLKHLIC